MVVTLQVQSGHIGDFVESNKHSNHDQLKARDEAERSRRKERLTLQKLLLSNYSIIVDAGLPNQKVVAIKDPAWRHGYTPRSLD